MKRSAPLALAALVAALLLGGCGGGSSAGSNSTAAPKKATAPGAPAGSKVVTCGAGTQLRATEVDCVTAEATMERWEQSGPCTLGDGDSRASCALGQFRCQAVKVDAGISVSCAGPDGDVSFIARPFD